MLKRLLRRAAPTTLPSADAYARWAPTYPPHAHNPLMAAEQAAMLDLLPPLAGAVVLDLACGTGRYGLLARERGAAQVIGLDSSAAMLRLNPLRSVALGSSEALPLAGGSVDVVLCGLALGHLPRLEPSLAEIARALKPGGAALVSDFHPFAFLSGRRRIFNAPDGRTYAVEHYPHLYADYHRAAASAGLWIEAVREPRLDAASGASAFPFVIVFRFMKTPHRSA